MGHNYATKEYRAWRAMKTRCLNPNASQYPRYGGRGVTVCPSWIKSYARFVSDMGAAPSARHSLERMDNNYGYYPSNCKWATPLEQAANRRPIKITRPAAISIVHNVANGLTHQRVADMFGITRAMVGLIWNGKRHKYATR